MSRGTVNKVILIGRLGRDPEMRYAPSGTPIAGFSVATNYSSKTPDGNWEDKTEWVNISTFNKQAEFAGEYLKKGSQVYVEGRLQTRSWEDDTGQKKYKTEVIANTVQSLGRNESAQDQDSKPAAAAASPDAASPAAAPPGGAAAASPPAAPPVEEDDLPF